MVFKDLKHNPASTWNRLKAWPTPNYGFDYYLQLFDITDLHMCREVIEQVFILFLQGHQGATIFSPEEHTDTKTHGHMMVTRKCELIPQWGAAERISTPGAYTAIIHDGADVQWAQSSLYFSITADPWITSKKQKQTTNTHESRLSAVCTLQRVGEGVVCGRKRVIINSRLKISFQL